MSNDTCRLGSCDRQPGVEDGYESRKYCSVAHELKYEHIRADAREAKRDAEREARENDDRHPGVRGDFL